MKKVLIAIILACTLFVLIVPAVYAGPPNKVYYKIGGKNGHYYQYMYDGEAFTFNEIYDYCSTLTYTDPKKGIDYQGHLLIIDSQRENGFVFRKLVKNRRNVLIALHYSGSSWEWEYPYGDNPSLVYTNWAEGFPINVGSGYDWVVMNDANGVWLNANNNSFHSWIVEYEPVP